MAVHLTRIYTKTGDDGTTALGDPDMPIVTALHGFSDADLESDATPEALVDAGYDDPAAGRGAATASGEVARGRRPGGDLAGVACGLQGVDAFGPVRRPSGSATFSWG